MLNCGHLCYYCAKLYREAYTVIPVGGMRKDKCMRCGKKCMGQEFEIEPIKKEDENE